MKSGWTLGGTLPSDSSSNLALGYEEDSKENSIGSRSYRIQGQQASSKQFNSNLRWNSRSNSLKEIEE
jgi:hypothetical protein